MGSDNSKLEQQEREEQHRRELAEVQRQMEQRAREQQQAEWRRAQELEKHHRKMREQEEVKLKKEREEWQRQENLRKQQLEQQLHEQQVQAQILHQKQLQQQQLQQQQLQQQQLYFVQQQHFGQQRFQQQQLQQQNSIMSPQYPPPSAVPSMPVAKPPKPRLPAQKARPQPAQLPALMSVTPQVNNDTQLSNERSEWTAVDYLQDVHGISKHAAENIISLFNEKNTVPFIASYRKDTTLGMDMEQLKRVKESYESVAEIKKKASDLKNTMLQRGEWTTELDAYVSGRKSLKELEWVQTMINISKVNPVKRAKQIGLENPAKEILQGKGPNDLSILVYPTTEGRKTVEQVRDGLIHILAYVICKEKSTLEMIKVLQSKHNMSIETTKINSNNDSENTAPNAAKNKVDEGKYSFYYNFSSAENKLKPHQISEINRGRAQKILNLNVKIPADFEKDFKEYCAMHYKNSCKASDLHKTLLTAAFDYAWKKMIKSSICDQTKTGMTKRAENALIDEIADDTKRLLLTPPVRGNVIIGIEPSLKQGCKLAVVAANGDVLETEKMNPHDADNPRAKHEAERILAGIILVHKCTILALGNGEGRRETESFLSELIEKRAFEPINVVYTTVDKIAAFTHRCSDKNTPDIADAGVAISIARRLLDPMGELVKIDPKKFDSKAYKFNLPAKRLALKVNEAITEAVSLVGVDVNTASLHLLKRVAGLNEARASNIIEWRTLYGPFKTKNDVKKARDISSKTFEQCAGFLRVIPETAIGPEDSATADDSFNHLDQTCIHPEHYDVAEAFLKAAKCESRQLGTKAFIFAVSLLKDQGINVLSKRFNTTVETMKIIIDSLSQEKGYDIRGKNDMSIFRTNTSNLESIQVGDVLKGVVRGIAAFGAFVDVGFEVQGLIHNTNMKGLTLTRGQKVETKVCRIDAARRRLGLTLVACT